MKSIGGTMQKELNPELFGEKKNIKAKVDGGSLSGSSEPAYLNVDRQIFELKTQTHSLQDQMNKLAGTVNELIKNTNLKFDRVNQSLLRLEQSHNGLAQESGQKLAQMAQKIAERRSMDAKIQEMVDRHNNIVKSFEVRMNHLQKLLAEKEAQMAAAQSALNEAKMEIARLKRF